MCPNIRCDVFGRKILLSKQSLSRMDMRHQYGFVLYSFSLRSSLQCMLGRAVEGNLLRETRLLQTRRAATTHECRRQRLVSSLLGCTCTRIYRGSNFCERKIQVQETTVHLRVAFPPHKILHAATQAHRPNSPRNSWPQSRFGTAHGRNGPTGPSQNSSKKTKSARNYQTK